MSISITEPDGVDTPYSFALFYVGGELPPLDLGCSVASPMKDGVGRTVVFAGTGIVVMLKSVRPLPDLAMTHTVFVKVYPAVNRALYPPAA